MFAEEIAVMGKRLVDGLDVGGVEESIAYGVRGIVGIGYGDIGRVVGCGREGNMKPIDGMEDGKFVFSGLGGEFWKYCVVAYGDGYG
jgi:hypothetical protein